MADQKAPVSFSVLPIADGKVPDAVNYGTIQLIAEAKDAPYQGPGYPVGHAGVVRVRAHNGAAAGNVGLVYVGLNRRDVIKNAKADGYALTPNTEIVFPVDTLAQIWFSAANAADGIQLSVKGQI